MRRIEQVVKSGISLETAKANLFIGNDQIYELNNKDSSVIATMNRIVEVAEELHSELHRSQSNQCDIVRNITIPD